jgi:Glyoxalase-like domain
MPRIDHVIFNVGDLDDAARAFRELYGLVALEGGVFPDGVANRVIPLDPPKYIELIAVVDRGAAERLMPADELAQFDSRRGWMGWGISGIDIEEVSARTGVPAVAGSIQNDEGVTMSSWRYVAPDDDEGGALPFFVAYDATPEERLALWTERSERAKHPCGHASLVWLEVAAREQRVRAWIGDLSLPLRRVDGPPGIRSVGLRTASGELTIDGHFDDGAPSS